MQCGTARSWMQMRRDATLPAAQARELEEHAIGCESCAAYAHEEQLLDGWLLQAPVAEPAANFEWRLKLRLAQLEREGRTPALPARALPWRPWAQFGGAMAAAALVVVAVGSQWFQERSGVPHSAVARIGSASSSTGQGGVVQPLRDSGPGTPSFVGPPVPPAYSYFVGSSDSSTSALDSARTPNTFEAR